MLFVCTLLIFAGFNSYKHYFKYKIRYCKSVFYYLFCIICFVDKNLLSSYIQGCTSTRTPPFFLQFIYAKFIIVATDKLISTYCLSLLAPKIHKYNFTYKNQAVNKFDCLLTCSFSIYKDTDKTKFYSGLFS